MRRQPAVLNQFQLSQVPIAVARLAAFHFAERKYIITLKNQGDEINASCSIKDLSDFVYDDIVSGDGKSPIKLQLRNSKEYIEVDWQYPLYSKENRKFEKGRIWTSMSNGDWQICDTGKKYMLILNYNRNNGYWMFDRDLIRSYTVEELEILIGVKTPHTSAEGVKFGK